MVYGLHRVLKDWSETGASWNLTGRGPAWTVPGANGADSDYQSTADSVASVGWNPEWLHFDVTAAVGQFSTSPGANFGWKVKSISGYTSGLKSFASSEYLSSPGSRPKLTITYK